MIGTEYVLSLESQDMSLGNLDVRLSKSKVVELRGQKCGLHGLE